MIVDASALVDAVLGTRRGAAVLGHLGSADWAGAPNLVYAEVASACWRLVRSGSLSLPEAEMALDRLRALRLRPLAESMLLPTAWSFREFARLTDAFYLASALALDVPLLTTDARLARAHHGVSVLLVQ